MSYIGRIKSAKQVNKQIRDLIEEVRVGAFNSEAEIKVNCKKDNYGLYDYRFTVRYRGFEIYYNIVYSKEPVEFEKFYANFKIKTHPSDVIESRSYATIRTQFNKKITDFIEKRELNLKLTETLYNNKVEKRIMKI